mmetsp:Transcript_65160/g.172636  ORF Transcript_65160/g.172636 Transcript_65160/m.172636 type:complete len:224 (+) Transcript_65160:1262-1933(+)
MQDLRNENGPESQQLEIVPSRRLALGYLPGDRHLFSISAGPACQCISSMEQSLGHVMLNRLPLGLASHMDHALVHLPLTNLLRGRIVEVVHVLQMHSTRAFDFCRRRTSRRLQKVLLCCSRGNAVSHRKTREGGWTSVRRNLSVRVSALKRRSGVIRNRGRRHIRVTGILSDREVLGCAAHAARGSTSSERFPGHSEMCSVTWAGNMRHSQCYIALPSPQKMT